MDVTGENGAPWRVDLDSIDITELEAGSSMRLRIWDPTNVVNIQDMARVEFIDVANNRRLFTGFVQQLEPVVAAVGRWVDVECVGLDAVLDWIIIPADVTYAAGTPTVNCIQNLPYRATGIGVQLNSASGFDSGGNAQEPVGHFGFVDLGVIFPRTLTEAVTIPAGSTLRQGIAALCAVTRTWIVPFGSDSLKPPFINATITVDWAGGLRVFGERELPTDYTGLTVNAGSGGTAPTRLEHRTNGLNVPRTVYIRGGNATGSGPVTDGSGIPGPTLFVDDSTITTASARDTLGKSILSALAVTEAGALELEGYTPTGNVHVGAELTLTSAQLGLSTDVFKIAELQMSFVVSNPYTMNWRVQYGRLRPGLVRSLNKTKYWTRS
jgi:hypothetical protein